MSNGKTAAAEIEEKGVAHVGLDWMRSSHVLSASVRHQPRKNTLAAAAFRLFLLIQHAATSESQSLL